MPVLIGTSGWQYKHWRGGLYPDSMPVRMWLQRYAECFATVEVNNAFYRLPERSTFEAWAAALPDDFVVAVKASRYLTHVRRLREPEEPVQRLMERATGLGAKLGPILLQLPPNMAIDVDRLTATLRAFPPAARVAVEFRHPSWFVPAVRRLLEDRAVALCLTDRGGPTSPLWRTAGWGYLRMHAGRGVPPSCYGHQALRSWAGRLAELYGASIDVFVYFNNDGFGCAPRDAARMAAEVRRLGISPTRTPPPREARLTA